MFLKASLSLLLSLVFSSAVSLLLNLFPRVHNSAWYISLSFFFILSFVLLLIYTLRFRKPEFTQLLLVCTVLKLLFSLIFIVCFSFGDKAAFFRFAIHFIFHFVFFTIFEILYILSLLKLINHETKNA